MSEAPEHPPRKRSCLRWVFRLFLYGTVLILLVVAFAALGAYLIVEHVTGEGAPGPAVRVEVAAGMSGRDVGRLLAQHGLVDHELLFRLAIRLDKQKGSVKHGRYDLPQGLSPTQLLHLLYEGPNVTLRPEEIPDDQKLKIPEGLSLQQIAGLFDDPDAFLEAARSPELIEKIGIEAETLEGFLMPNTYFFDAPPTPREAVERMVDQFMADYQALMEEVPGAASRSILEVVTVASLVEEEAAVPEERPLVAAVIYNRLAKGMALDLDATLQYALGKYGERMLDEDKAVDSPYNTYRYAGLPPGPICSPGADALRAALSPSDEDYLFFVSNADGKTHVFSRTMAEHAEAVKRYRREIAVQRRQLREQGTDNALQ